MDNLVKTTILLPEQLLQKARYYAVRHRTTISQIIREGLTERITKTKPQPSTPQSILEIAGTLDLGGKRPPTRRKLYEKIIER